MDNNTFRIDVNHTLRKIPGFGIQNVGNDLKPEKCSDDLKNRLMEG